jgi:hypothetical protein
MVLKSFIAMKGKATHHGGQAPPQRAGTTTAGTATAIRRLFVLIPKRHYDGYLVIFEILRRARRVASLPS